MNATTTERAQDKRVNLLKRVFATAKEHGIKPEDLREMVPGWGLPRLSQCDKWDLQKVLEHLGRWFQATGTTHRASQKQLDYIQQLWEDKSDAGTKASLEQYAFKKFGIQSLEYSHPDQASKVIQSLKRWSK